MAFGTNLPGGLIRYCEVGSRRWMLLCHTIMLTKRANYIRGILWPSECAVVYRYLWLGLCPGPRWGAHISVNP